MIKTVSVTLDDIQDSVVNGKPNIGYCPIDRAIERVTGRRVSTGIRRVYLHGVDITQPVDSVDLPQEAIRFVEEFDMIRDVEPFVFFLDIPESFFAEEKLKE